MTQIDDETVQRPMEDGASAPPPRAALRLVFPGHLERTVVLGSEEIVLGRRPGGDDDTHRIDDATVSRRHLRIRRARGRFLASDLGSRNGSRIDGVRVGAEPIAIDDGAVLRIGDVIFVCEEGVGQEDAPSVSREAVFGESAAAVRLRAAIALAAPDPSPVLLVGPTGTGKEFIAREIHRLSGRRGPLLAVNCAALSPQLVESQLFGHAKGAFTGAVSAHEGLFRAADGGTIFLDEVGELSSELQPKLLRVLQEGEVLPVGEVRPVKVDVRVVAATLRDLTELVEAGGFRLDLYARLSPWEIEVPALRARRADILAWLERLHARWYRERQEARGDGALEVVPLRLEANAVERILLHGWRDNLRGLDRLVHRACADRTGVVDVAPEPVPDRPDDRPSSPDKRDKPTREELARVLAAHDGSVRATAKHFGRDRRQIYRWLDQYGLRSKDE